jgi:hypothetical protein
MRTSSSTANIVVVSGMTEVEMDKLLSRLRYMQKIGVFSKEVHYGTKSYDCSSSESVSSRQGCTALPDEFVGA